MLPKELPETPLNGLHLDNSFEINPPKSARICENHDSRLPGIDIFIYLHDMLVQFEHVLFYYQSQIGII